MWHIQLSTFSVHGIGVFVIGVSFERHLCDWQGAWVDRTGGTQSPSLPFGLSLLASAGLKEHLLWHVMRTAVFPMWILWEFSKIPVCTGLWYPWLRGAVSWGKSLCVSWWEHSSVTDLHFLFAFEAAAQVHLWGLISFSSALVILELCIKWNYYIFETWGFITWSFKGLNIGFESQIFLVNKQHLKL